MKVHEGATRAPNPAQPTESVARGLRATVFTIFCVYSFNAAGGPTRRVGVLVKEMVIKVSER